jgi:SAM domain (Sterile alpha motif)
VDVAEWLCGLGLEQYAQLFRDNDIDGEILFGMTAEDLKELGISSFGHRRKLLNAITALGGEPPTEYGCGWIGFNLLPDQAAEKIKRIEELLKANGRNRSDVKLAVSPYTNPIKTDDLKRYRDEGVEEVALMAMETPRTERDVIAGLEQMAREFVEPAGKL